LIRVSLGAYALDALDPAERASIEAHLPCCQDCRRELAQLSETAQLLVHVPLVEVERAGLVATHNLESADDQQTRRTRAWRAGTAVAVVAAVAAAAVSLVWAGGGHHPAPGRVSLTASASDRATHVSAKVTLQRRGSGTVATLIMEGVRPRLQCRLVVLALNGRREFVATYQADPDGTADVTTESAIPITAIASVEVLAGHNQRVVRIPVHDSRPGV
jgi:anti-sigma factor RsiW